MALPPQQAFLLEPVCIIAGPKKITANMSDQVQYLVHHKLVQERFYNMKILYKQVFYLMDWEMII
jgi:hypothetical protein